jgi:hypothetical protein
MVEFLVRNYATTTADWPLSFAQKVQLIQVLTEYPGIIVVPRRTVSCPRGLVGEAAWGEILSMVVTFPDLRVNLPADQERDDQSQNSQCAAAVSATAFTPDPTLQLSGWAACPWNSEKYYVRYMDPRLSCIHDQSTGAVTCSDSNGFLAIVLDIQRLCAVTCCESSELETLEDAEGTAKIFPVHCRFSTGRFNQYTLLDQHTGKPLQDPDYVGMAPSVFGARVTQIKPKQNRASDSAAAEPTVPNEQPDARPAKVRRKHTDDSATGAPSQGGETNQETDDVCDICEQTHDESDNPLCFCEAPGPHDVDCTRCTHVHCMGLTKEPKWSFCRAHSREIYDIRCELRTACKVATEAAHPVHTKTSWCRWMRDTLAKHGEALGETTVRDFMQFDPGTEFTPHNEQGSLATNLSFMRYMRRRNAAAAVGARRVIE